MQHSSIKISLYKNNSAYFPLTASILAIVIYILEDIILSKPLSRFITYLFAYPFGWKERFLSAVTIIFSFYLLVCFIWTILISPRYIKIILIFLFSASQLAEYNYQKTVGRFLLPADINMGIRSGMATWKDALILFFDWRSVVVALFSILIFWILPSKVDIKKTLLGIFIILLGFTLINLTPVTHNININWGASPIQFSSALYRYALDLIFPLNREPLTFRADTAPQNNIVLIVDESVGGEYLSINGFTRATTPYLAQLATQTKLFHNWGIAVPSATCSEISNAMILTGAQAGPGIQKSVYHFPTVYQYAQAMGYKTYYIDGQMSVLWAGISDKDIKFIDHWVIAPDLGQDSRYRDFFAADMIRRILDSSTGNLIVLNKNGIHFLYQDNYPMSNAIWSPVPTNVDQYKYYDLMVNDYSNAIRFNVDTFFQHLFPDLGKLDMYTKTTYYIYTSDHGQTLFQEGAASLHCGDTRLETRVPLIILGKFDRQPDTTYLASHSNILPTILDLMHVPEENLPSQLNLSLLEAEKTDSRDRLFFAGFSDNIFNHDELEREQKK